MKKFYISAISILLIFFVANSLAYVFVPNYVEHEVNDSKKELKDKLSNAILKNHFFVVDNDTRFIPKKVFNSEKYRTYVLNWDSCHWRIITSVLKDDILFNYIIVPNKIVFPRSVPDDIARNRLQIINQLEFERYVESNKESNVWYWDFCDNINKYESKHFEIIKDITYSQNNYCDFYDIKHRYKEWGVAYHDSICAKEVFVIKRKTNSSSDFLIQYYRNFIIATIIIETILLALIVTIVFLIVRKRKRKKIMREYESINKEARTLFAKEYRNRYDKEKESVYISQEIKDAARRLLRGFDSNFESMKYMEFVNEHKEEIIDFLQKDALYVKVHEIKKKYRFGFEEYAKEIGLYSDLSKWQESSLLKVLSNDSINIIKEADNRLKIENEYRIQVIKNFRRLFFVEKFYNKPIVSLADKEWICENISNLDSFIDKTIADFTSRMALSYPLGYEHFKIYYGKTHPADYEILSHENEIKEKHAILVEWEKLKLSYPGCKIEIAKNHSIESLITPNAIFGLYDKNILNISELTRKLHNTPITYKNNAYNIAKLLKDNRIECFYHLTDVRNIPLIKDIGGLCSWDFLYNNKVKIPFQGGDEDSMKYDKKHGLEDYVRLSFCKKQPMEYRLKQMGANLVILRISVEVAKFANTFFYNMNEAYSPHSNIEQLSGLLKENIEATKTRIFVRDDNNIKLKQLEVMVKTFIPSDLILNFNDL